MEGKTHMKNTKKNSVVAKQKQTPLPKEKLPPCKICRKVWKREESDQWAYHDGTLACLSHHGIKECIEKLMLSS